MRGSVERLLVLNTLPLPEMVLNSEDLRDSLSFLGDVATLWDRLSRTLEKKRVVPESLFLQGFSRLKWKTRGELLQNSLLYLRLHHQHGLSCRFHLPLLMRVDRTKEYQSNISVSEEIRIYPTLFAEHRLNVTSNPRSDSKSISSIIKRLISNFKKSDGGLRRSISRLLFGNTGTICGYFSNPSIIRIFTGRPPPNPNILKMRNAFVGISLRNRQVLLESTKPMQRSFLERVTSAMCLAISQRMLLPNIWEVLRQSTEQPISKVTSLLETLLLPHNPRHLKHSEKLHLKLFPFSYQRKAYETTQHLLISEDIHAKIEESTPDFLRSISDVRRFFLMGVSPPLNHEINQIIADIHQDSRTLELKVPLKTVFDYLVFAHLHDQYRRECDPQTYLISDERIGMRNANRIFQGCKRIEKRDEPETRVREKDLTPVPGVLLQHLLKLNLIRMGSGRMTSSRGAFSVNIENPLVIDYMRNALESLDPLNMNNIILELGA